MVQFNANDSQLGKYEALLEEESPNIALLLPQKPRTNSGDRACLLVFCIVGLSVFFSGPTLLYKQPLDYTRNTNPSNESIISPFNLTWHMWNEPMYKNRPSILIEDISIVEWYPIYKHLQFRTKLNEIKQGKRIQIYTNSKQINLFIVNQNGTHSLSTQTLQSGHFYVDIDRNWMMPVILLTNSDQGSQIMKVLYDGLPLVNWICSPGLLGEQFQIFNRQYSNTVEWINVASSPSKFTWYQASFMAKPNTQGRLRFLGMNHTLEYVYFNGKLVDREDGSMEMTYPVSTEEINVLTVLDVDGVGINNIQVTMKNE